MQHILFKCRLLLQYLRTKMVLHAMETSSVLGTQWPIQRHSYSDGLDFMIALLLTWEQVDQASAAYWADIRPPKHYDVEAAILQLFNRMFRRVLLAI